MSDIVRHKPGIYLGLPFEDYLADDALGSSDLKTLLASPPDYWWGSKLNTILPEEEDDAAHFDLGTAFHCLALEGEAEYEKRCILRPDTYPDTKTGEPKKFTLQSNWCKAWYEEHDRPGVTIITKAQDTRARLMHRMLMRDPKQLQLAEGESLALADAFNPEIGLSEVSVFYEQDGIRRRARFDKLLPNAICDVKTISGWRQSDFKQSLLREAILRGYVLQAVDYMEARSYMRDLFEQGLVFGGTPTQREALAEICEATEWRWVWVYARTSGAPQVKGIAPPIPNGQFEKAKVQREQALAMYHYYDSFFGHEPGVLWHEPEVVWEPTEEEWPSWSTLPEA